MSFREPVSLDALNQRSQNTMLSHVGIVFTGVGDDWLRATMPVDHRTRQPYGILHGGASVVLAETLGSIAGMLCLDTDNERCVGLDINANHLRSVHEGVVTGTARPLHIGRKTHVWEIRIENEDGQLVCISRLTLAILRK